MKNGCANRRQSQTRLSCAEVKPVIDEVNEEWLREPKDFRRVFLWSGMPSNIQEFFRNIFFLIIPGLFLIIPDQDKRVLELGDGTAGGAGDD